MDPILIVILVAVAALAGPKLLKVALANAIFSFNKNRQIKKVAKDRRKKYKKAKKKRKNADQSQC